MSIKLKQGGFSLVELLVTIAIFVVLATYAVPSYQNMVQNSHITTAKDAILTGLQLARAEAVKRNTNVQFDFRSGASDWTVCLSPAGGGSCPADTDGITVQSRSSTSGTVTAVPNNGPYVFNSFGLLVSPAGAAAITIDNSALSSAKSRELEVRIAAGGSIRSCDPNTSLATSDPRRCP